MKSEKLVAILLLTIGPGMGAKRPGAADNCVMIHLHDSALVPPAVLGEAETTATRILGSIGVSARWSHSASHSPVEDCTAIQVQFDPGAPKNSFPGALAYALPYRNDVPQIHVFLDRILLCPSLHQKGLLLGHVLTHEVGHVLEGASRHSGEGVMKAHWTGMDFHEMFNRSLRFTDLDVVMIHTGLSKVEIASSIRPSQ